MSNNPLYNIREAGDNWKDLDTIYASYEGLFSFEIHHGGYFTPKPGMTYEGGKISHADCINIDLFSVHEMDSIMQDLGYTGKQVMLYSFLKPGFDIDNGLVPLSSDQDVIKLSTYVTNNRLISVYIEHGKSNLGGYYSPMKLSIELIDDDDEVSPSKPKKAKPIKKTEGKSVFRKMLLDWDVEPDLTQTSQKNTVNDNVQPLNTQTSTNNVVNDNVGGGSNVNDNVVNEMFVNDNVEGLNDNVEGGNTGNDNVGGGNNVNDNVEVGNTKNSHQTKAKGKRPVVEEGSDSDSSSDSEDSDSNSDSDDSEDSDYLVDEANEIDDVEVDMRDFHMHIDEDVEYMGNHVPVNADIDADVEVEVIDNEDFESGSDANDDVSKLRNRLLKKVGKKKSRSDVGNYKTVFYTTQTFGSAAEVKDMIKRHAVETRRELKIVKNDKIRIRVACEGKMSVFNQNGENEAQVDKGSMPVKCGPKEVASGPSQSTRLKKTVKAKQVVDTSGETNLKEVDGDSKINKGGRGHKTDPDAFKCPWTLHVSKITGEETWMVKTCKDEHKCLQSRNIKQCTYKYLGKSIIQQIEGNPEIPAKALQGELQRKFEIGLSQQKAQRAKKSAKKELRGYYTKQYSMLRDYIQELQTSNPGTTVKLEVERPQHADQPTRVFKRIYVCLGPLKRGFKTAGRELIGLDGAFMSGPFPGQILTAVSLDTNNGIYPIAYAVVEAETLNSWTWFLDCLCDDLDLEVRSNYTFISDRQKGLIPAISKMFPCAEHRYCLRHIHENMKLQWRGAAFKNHLWKCATATTVQEFTSAMAEFRSYSEAAHAWLSKIPPQHWARSHFSGRSKSDVLLNNMCEVFNSKTVKARDKPIIHCLEFIREYLMIRIVNVGKIQAKCEGALTPTATRILELAKTDAHAYTAIFNGLDKYQVNRPWGDQCVVDISKMTCSCRRWEITGIPCKHAIRANWDMGNNSMQVGEVETWVDPIYRLDTWKLMYQFKITPTTGANFWTKSRIPTTIIPPKYHKPVGRPKKKRRKTAEEIEMVSNGKLSRKFGSVYCKNCGKAGHNKRSCKVVSSQPTQTSQTAASASHQVPSASQQVPTASQAASSASQQASRQTASQAPNASQSAPASRKKAPRPSQKAPKSQKNAPMASQSQNPPRPNSPSYRTGGLVKSPGGSKWIKYQPT